MSTTMTIRLDDDLKRRLENLAESTHRSNPIWRLKRSSIL